MSEELKKPENTEKYVSEGVYNEDKINKDIKSIEDQYKILDNLTKSYILLFDKLKEEENDLNRISKYNKLFNEIIDKINKDEKLDDNRKTFLKNTFSYLLKDESVINIKISSRILTEILKKIEKNAYKINDNIEQIKNELNVFIDHFKREKNTEKTKIEENKKKLIYIDSLNILEDILKPISENEKTKIEENKKKEKELNREFEEKKKKYESDYNKILYTYYFDLFKKYYLDEITRYKEIIINIQKYILEEYKIYKYIDKYNNENYIENDKIEDIARITKNFEKKGI